MWSRKRQVTPLREEDLLLGRGQRRREDDRHSFQRSLLVPAVHADNVQPHRLSQCGLRQGHLLQRMSCYSRFHRGIWVLLLFLRYRRYATTVYSSTHQYYLLTEQACLLLLVLGKMYVTAQIFPLLM